MEEDKKRDYQAEYEKDKQRDKIYRVRVPLYKSKLLDEKLKKENKTYSSIALEAIEKFLKKKIKKL